MGALASPKLQLRPDRLGSGEIADAQGASLQGDSLRCET